MKTCYLITRPTRAFDGTTRNLTGEFNVLVHGTPVFTRKDRAEAYLSENLACLPRGVIVRELALDDLDLPAPPNGSSQSLESTQTTST